jgi:uncharacterized protein
MVQDIDDLFIPLPCGTRLAGRMWRGQGASAGADAGPVPAILEFIPYRKRDATLPRDETIHPWMAAQGYACLRVDLRGSGDSDGLLDDEYSPQELADAVAVIDWIARQDWCSGAVGMMGKSWGGFNALQTAALAPPALRAVVSVCATVDRFGDDIHFKGGCLMGANFAWGSLMLSYQSRPPDPMLRPDWRAALRARIAALPHFSALWAGHRTRDAYWRHGSVGQDWAALDMPVLIVGGWADGYMNAPAALALHVPGARALVGPWVHQYPHTAVPGPQIDFLGEMKRWWDHWLKGQDTGADRLPNYRVFMQDSHHPDPCKAQVPGRFLAETLPSPRVRAQVLALGGDGGLGGAGRPDRIIASPQTLGARTGEYFPMGLSGEMPGDQRCDDARSVCFDLACPGGLALLGAARLELELSADRAAALVHARLCDVAPDGASLRIAHGFVNLEHRTDPPAPLVPGEVVRVTLDLDQMAHRLAPGHRLRLALSNACWPFVWPSPEPVALHLTGGSLSLPVHDDTAPALAFDPPPTVPASRLEQVPPMAGRRLDIDLIDATQRLIVTADGGVQRNPDHGLATQWSMTQTWIIAPDDPASARATIRWDQSHSRPDGWAVRSVVSTGQWCAGDAFELEATVRIEIDEPGQPQEVIVREFTDRVPRRAS